MVWTSDAVLKAMMQLWGPSLTGPTAAFSCQKIIEIVRGRLSQRPHMGVCSDG